MNNNILINVLATEGREIYIHSKANYESDHDPQGSRGSSGTYTTHREINLLIISENGI